MKHYGDITKIHGYDLPIVDVIMGGSPCQSLSITQSKTRQNLDGKSKLFFEYLRAFETIQPKYFLLENDEISNILLLDGEREIPEWQRSTGESSGSRYQPSSDDGTT